MLARLRAFLQLAQTRLVLALIVWLGAFGVGLTVPSQPFRNLVVSSCFKLADAPALVTASAAAQPTGDLAQAHSAQNGNASHTFNALVVNYHLNAPQPISQPAKLRVLTGSELAVWGLPLLFAIFITFTPINLLILSVFGALMGACAGELLSQSRSAGDAGNRRVVLSHHSAVAAMLSGLCVYLGVAAGLIVFQGDIKWDISEPDLYVRLSAFATLLSVVAGSNPDFLRQLAAAFRPFATPKPPADQTKPPPSEE